MFVFTVGSISTVADRLLMYLVAPPNLWMPHFYKCVLSKRQGCQLLLVKFFFGCFVLIFCCNKLIVNLTVCRPSPRV